MKRSSPLNSYLKGLQSAGRFESSGHFTISPEKALEKLAKFALPLPESWVLSLVQFAVGAGASEIKFALRADTLQMQATLHKDWSFPNFQERLYELPADLPKELEALLLALWQTSFAQARRVLFSPPSGPSYLLGNGTLEQVEGINENSLSVEVSHQSFNQQSQEKPAILNANILELLSEKAFVCPIPLWVDGRRIDHLVPEREVALIDVFDLPGEAPRIPVARIGTPYRLDRAGRYQRREEFVWPGELEVHGLCLLFLSTRLAHQEEGGLQLELDHAQSSVNWVQHGVLVDKGSIMVPYCRGFGLQVFLSAEGLSTDLSGQLVRDREYKERRARALRSIASRLTGRDHDFDFLALEPKAPVKKLFFGLIALTGFHMTELNQVSLDIFRRSVDQEYDKMRKYLVETYPFESA